MTYPDVINYIGNIYCGKCKPLSCQSWTYSATILQRIHEQSNDTKNL